MMQALNPANKTLTPSLGHFRKDYINQYFPRASIIGSNFLHMTPQQCDTALLEVVNLFASEPWFYFQNKPDGIMLTRYWEVIVDQLSIIHEYLVILKVRLPSVKIYRPQDAKPLAKGETSIYLFDYLLDNVQPSALPTFLALSYDYVNKLFMEAIKFKELKLARHYYKELEYLVANLKNTIFEKDYCNHFSSDAREVMDLLKKKSGFTDDEIDAMMAKKPGGGYG